ncbi:MAG: hypothetical protein HQK55_02105 [Deltaproteobacteria bacterium]|nr:hypothetical protein [Deltaproteobacteria bacterium]
MFLILEIFLFLSQVQGIDPGIPAAVKNGVDKLSEHYDWVSILLVITALLIVVIILIGLLFYLVKRARQAEGPADMLRVTLQDDIRDLINRSIDFRSIYDIVVHDPDYREIYRGQALGINWDDEIEVEIAPYIDPNLDFFQKKVSVSFRITDHGQHESYAFDSVSKYIDYTDNYGKRARALRLNLPETIAMGQKRRYLRLAPEGEYAFSVVFFEPVHHHAPPLPLNLFRRLYSAEVSDISIGGMQVVLHAKTAEVKLRAGDETYVYFRLPLTGLDVQNVLDEFFLRVKVVSLDRLITGRRVMSLTADRMIPGPHSIRLQFLGRGLVDRKQKQVVFQQVAAENFADLAHWLTAYHRHKTPKLKTAEAKS